MQRRRQWRNLLQNALTSPMSRGHAVSRPCFRDARTLFSPYLRDVNPALLLSSFFIFSFFPTNTRNCGDYVPTDMELRAVCVCFFANKRSRAPIALCNFEPNKWHTRKVPIICYSQRSRDDHCRGPFKGNMMGGVLLMKHSSITRC